MASASDNRLTKKVVDQATVQLKRYCLWDAELKGFGLQVEVSGTKTYFVRYRPRDSGRKGPRPFVKIGRHGDLTAEQARSAAKVILGAVASGADPAASRDAARAEHDRKAEALSFQSVAERFLAEHATAKRKARTAANYETLFRLHAWPALGSKKAEAITRADLVKLHSAMSRTPHNANRLLAVIGSMYSYASKSGLVPDGFNPARGIEKFREEGRERYLRREEIGRLGAALLEGERHGFQWAEKPATESSKHRPKKDGDPREKLDPYAAAAIRLLMLTGARLREVLHLRWREVDLERGLLLLPDSKTGRKTIVLSQAAIGILQTLRAMEGSLSPASCVIKGRIPDQPRADLQRPWAAVRRHAKLEDVRLHDLRHTFASLGAGAGLGLPIVGKLLGHANPQTTARYAHLDADPLRRATDIIGDQLTAAMISSEPRSQL